MATHRRRKRRPGQISLWRRALGWVKAHWQGLGLSLLIAINLLLWMVFVLPEYTPRPVECPGLPLKVSLRYPHYVTVRDESFIEVGLHNTGTQPISGTAVVAFGGDLCVHPLLAKTNTLSFTELPPGGIMTDQVRFTLSEQPTRLGGTLPFTVQVTAGQSCVLSAPPTPLVLVPLPGLRAGLTAILSGALSVAPLAGLLGEQIKKRWFPE